MTQLRIQVVISQTHTLIDSFIELRLHGARRWGEGIFHLRRESVVHRPHLTVVSSQEVVGLQDQPWHRLYLHTMNRRTVF